MSSYHIAKNGQQSGPYDEDHIRRQITEGRLAATDLCWCEGMAAWQPISDVFNMQSVIVAPPPIPEHGTNAKETNSPLFLYIPVSRLIILSIVSMSLYEAYWVYKNWRYIKERDGLDIRPFWRGWFGVFFCHSLLRRIHEDGQARACVQPSFSPSGLATGWVVLLIVSNLMSRAPGVLASMIAAFIPSFLCLVPVQNYINAVTEKRNPGLKYYRWSSGHIVCLVFGIIVWALLLIGLGADS
jgi:hypothetical protein